MRDVNFLEFKHKSLEREDGFVYHKDKPEWGGVVCIGKPIPLQSYYRPRRFQGVETLRFRDNRHMKVVRASAPHTRRPYAPRKYSWYSFLLETESTPGSQCSRKDYVNEKFQRQHRESNQRPSGLCRSASTNCATTFSKFFQFFFS